MSIQASKKALVFTVVVTIGFSLFVGGVFAKFENVVNGYALILLLLSVAFFFMADKIDARLNNRIFSAAIKMLMGVLLGLSINSIVLQYSNGLWWAYILGGAFLYSYASEVTEWLT